jgi:serine protease Do
MERRVAIKRSRPSNGAQVEEYPLQSLKELTIGRDASCDIKYDPDQEDLVSRRHAKIVVEDSEKCSFLISDLGSRNGTFVNKQRIFGPVHLAPGDVVQLGAGGPEFQFDLDPRPQEMARPTRLAANAGLVTAPGPTREAPSVVPAVLEPQKGPAAVGRATVERMIADTKKETRRSLLGGGIVVLLICVVAVVGIFLWHKRGPVAPSTPVATSSALSPDQVAQAYTDSVIYIEAGWKLVSTSSGRQINQLYVPNQAKDKEGKDVRVAPVAQDYLPVFAVMDNGIEPLLTTDDGKGRNRPIGGQHSGSGFVVGSDGFALTNRHVAASWYSVYSWPPDQAGLLIAFDNKLQVKQQTVIGPGSFPMWVPANAKFVFEGAVTPESLRFLSPFNRMIAKQLEGRNDYLDVTFAKNRIRIPAKTARVSDDADVAMIKVELPQSLHKTDLNDNYNTIKVGDQVVVMGYPGVSPKVFGTTRSADPLNQENVVTVIPDPTLSVGNIGRVIRGQAGLNEATVSTMGDVYQLTINSTGHGNSGGPVFDNQGRVIGIFTYGFTPIGDAAITFAVPIRYGMELMGVRPAK